MQPKTCNATAPLAKLAKQHLSRCRPQLTSSPVTLDDSTFRSSTITPVEELPAHTPKSSTTWGKAQHSPLASRAPLQQVPVKSMMRPLPPQTPHASRPWLQHWPALSRVTLAPAVVFNAQQVPASLTTPGAQEEACWCKLSAQYRYNH